MLLGRGGGGGRTLTGGLGGRGSLALAATASRVAAVGVGRGVLLTVGGRRGLAGGIALPGGRGHPWLAVRLAPPLRGGGRLEAHPASGGTEQFVGPRQTHSA
ncbi:hypothetical protein SSIG_07308 [Streptomyces filamentosus NRRL 11379]|nr:hypothetical protein SSIG_07308 [Streptomyces filamentosus NRRL 11379]